MLPGVRPSIIRASSPTATMRGRLPLSSCAIATTDGSVSTIPLPRTYTMTFAVPRSMPIWRANKRWSFQAAERMCGKVSLRGSGTHGDEDEVGEQAGKEADGDAPPVPDGRVELATGVEELADHEHEGPRRDGEEQHRDRGRREPVADDG